MNLPESSRKAQSINNPKKNQEKANTLLPYWAMKQCQKYNMKDVYLSVRIGKLSIMNCIWNIWIYPPTTTKRKWKTFEKRIGSSAKSLNNMKRKKGGWGKPWSTHSICSWRSMRNRLLKSACCWWIDFDFNPNPNDAYINEGMLNPTI